MLNIIIFSGAALLIVLFMVLTLIAHYKMRQQTLKNRKRNDIIKQVLDMGDYFMVYYDMCTGLFSNIYGQKIPEEGITFEQFLSFCHPDERDAVKKEMEQLMNGSNDEWKVLNHWNLGSHEKPNWQLIQGDVVSEKLQNGRVRGLVATLKNVTEEKQQIQEEKILVNKYIKIFDSLLVAMSFFDKRGILLDMNVNMKTLLNVTQENEEFFLEMRLFDIPLFRNDIDPANPTEMYVCQHAYYPELNFDKYIEYKISPLFNESGELIYYIVTARDVTEERQVYVNLTLQNRKLQNFNETIVHYEKHLEYILKKGNMFVFRHDLENNMINISHSLGKVEYALTFEEYLGLHFEEDRKRVTEHVKKAVDDHRPTNSIRHFHHTPVDEGPAWYAISTMPVYDDDKQLTGYFGVLRNITELIEAQEQLRIETARADRSGRMKSAFLANMTHEIRTPLNAIVGFSDLLHVIDEPKERQEFIRIILNNCDMLLRLINDILRSNDAANEQLTIDPTDIDFAIVFDDIWQSLAQRVDKPDVEFLKDNPYIRFFTCLDKGRIQQVCTNFVTNAVKYTKHGHIKLGYSFKNGGLYIYCEDTGAGIPKEKQASVFDRFVKLDTEVQGTGLGLNICRNIAKQCGGDIGVTSEGEGHGSTFWIWIPCERFEAQKQ